MHAVSESSASCREEAVFGWSSPPVQVPQCALARAPCAVMLPH